MIPEYVLAKAQLARSDLASRSSTSFDSEVFATNRCRNVRDRHLSGVRLAANYLCLLVQLFGLLSKLVQIGFLHLWYGALADALAII